MKKTRTIAQNHHHHYCFGDGSYFIIIPCALRIAFFVFGKLCAGYAKRAPFFHKKKEGG
jgi:hypothetical protein